MAFSFSSLLRAVSPARNDSFIGGQAVAEGIMMHNGRCYALSVRKPCGEIKTVLCRLAPSSLALRLGKIPILRGVHRLWASMITGVKVMHDAAEMAGFEDDAPPTKFDLWLDKKLGDKLTKYIIALSLVIALAFGVFLFILVPVLLSGFLGLFLAGNLWVLGIIEGLVRMGIFLAYLVIVSRMKEIRSIYQYHGAEHKTINCHERGEPLTVDNIRRHSRLHRRCGTSFVLFILVISMIFFLFVRTDALWMRILSRLALVPFVAGASYEVILWAGRRDSEFMRLLSSPGMALQGFTTAEPGDEQIEVAKRSLEAVLSVEEISKIADD